METKTKCKAIENGKYTKMVTMPKAWCDAYGVNPGSNVGVDIDKGSRVIVFAKPRAEGVYCRKVIKNGEKSAFVTLPAEWCAKKGIKAGDTVTVQTAGDTLIIEANNA